MIWAFQWIALSRLHLWCLSHLYLILSACSGIVSSHWLQLHPRTFHGLFSLMTLFITYLLLSHVPRVPLNLDSQALRKACGVSWCLTHVCSNHPPLSKLVTSCTSKGIWFIRGATPQDFERPSTCLSKLTFLAISIYFLFALSCGSAEIHPLAAGAVVHLQ